MISVIIPTHAEGDRLAEGVAALHAIGLGEEILVAAHLESPETRRRVERGGAVRWLTCPAASRGAQLARGAAEARGDVLLFLHADTRLPDDAGGLLRGALADPRVAGGAFRLAFDARHPALALLERLSALEWRSAYLGDQALFCRTAHYHAAGGFRPLPLFEDVDFIRRLARQGRLARLPAVATTSARRFTAAGPWRQLLRNALLLTRYYLGEAPERLAREYRPASRGDHAE